jgi:hypothetical protein
LLFAALLVLQAANLNNCLTNVIYTNSTADAAAAAAAAAEAGRAAAVGAASAAAAATAAAEAAAVAAIPAQELVVVFDADMVAKPNFFRHVSRSHRLCVLSSSYA